MSDDQFTVDDTLIMNLVSQKGFRPKDGSNDGNGTNFHGQKHSSDIHESTTDRDARLYKKATARSSIWSVQATRWWRTATI